MTEYEKNIQKWLLGTPVKNKPGLLPGGKSMISDMTDEPEKFILAVKKIIELNLVPDIEFSEDYKYIRRMNNLITKKISFKEQYQQVFKQFIS